MTEIAVASGVPIQTLRKIETGRIVTPAFFTVAALASALGLPLEQIASHCTATAHEASRMRTGWPMTPAQGGAPRAPLTSSKQRHRTATGLRPRPLTRTARCSSRRGTGPAPTSY